MKLDFEIEVDQQTRTSDLFFHPDWTKNDRVMSKKPYAHIWACVPNLIDFGGIRLTSLYGHIT